jgi:hypothetical protein
MRLVEYTDDALGVRDCTRQDARTDTAVEVVQWYRTPGLGSTAEATLLKKVLPRVALLLVRLLGSTTCFINSHFVVSNVCRHKRSSPS